MHFRKRKYESKTCLRWPPTAAISSSIDTNVPAKVPRKRPYLSVSFKAVTMASLFDTTISFLNKDKPFKSTIAKREHGVHRVRAILWLMVIHLSPWRLFPRDTRQDREESETALEASSDREALRRCDGDFPKLLRRGCAAEGTETRRRRGRRGRFVRWVGVVIVEAVGLRRVG